MDGIWWLLISLGPLFFFHRSLQKQLQIFFLLLTHKRDISLVLFSILLFPGVLLHELSHFLMAKLLRVETGRFSIIPLDKGNGKLRLGYVETEEVDFFRDSLIGFAPLISGMLFVGFIGRERLGLDSVWSLLNHWNTILLYDSFQNILAEPNFWVWFYLSVVISSTMLPSSSDRKAWVPLLLALLLIVLVGIGAGAGPVLLDQIFQPMNNTFKSMAVVFGFSGALQLVVLIPVLILNNILSRFTVIGKLI